MSRASTEQFSLTTLQVDLTDLDKVSPTNKRMLQGDDLHGNNLVAEGRRQISYDVLWVQVLRQGLRPTTLCVLQVRKLTLMVLTPSLRKTSQNTS